MDIFDFDHVCLLVERTFEFWDQTKWHISLINEGPVICGPISCMVDFRCGFHHSEIILLNLIVQTALCNKTQRCHYLEIL